MPGTVISGMDLTVWQVRPDSVEEMTSFLQESPFEPCPTLPGSDQNSPFQVSPRRARSGPGYPGSRSRITPGSRSRITLDPGPSSPGSRITLWILCVPVGIWSRTGPERVQDGSQMGPRWVPEGSKMGPRRVPEGSKRGSPGALQGSWSPGSRPPGPWGPWIPRTRVTWTYPTVTLGHP